MRYIYTTLLAAAVSLGATATAPAQLDPNAFLPVGTLLLLNPGTVTINTDALTVTEMGFTFPGVAINQPNGPQIAVFDFNSITIPSGSSVSVTGSRSLALLSANNITIAPGFSLSPGTLGGYAGATATSSDIADHMIDSHPGLGPGGGAVSGMRAGGGGNGGPGGPPVGGPSNGGLPQILQGGSGGGAVSNTGLTNTGGSGGGAIEIVANGSVTLGGSVSANGGDGSGGNNGGAGGGAGGSILVSGGTGLSLAGNLNAIGGSAATFDVNGTGGGGGRIMLGGLANYTLGSTLGATANVNAGTNNGGGGAGYAGTITIDALATTVPSGYTTPLTGSPTFSVGGGTQTSPYIEAFVRHDLVVNSGGTATLQMNDVLKRLNAAGNNVTSLTVDGTFDLNGFNQTVNTLSSASSSSSANVKLTNGGVLTVGVGNGSGSYFGQITGTGSLVKAGTGTLTLNGASTFTGPTIINGGTLTVTNDLALQNSTVTAVGGTVTFASPTSSPKFGGLAGTGSIDLTGLVGLTVGANNASTTYSGSITGGGSLFKLGTGTLTLAGASTFTGGTFVSVGTVAVANDYALQSSEVVLNSGGSIQFAPGAVNPVFGGLFGSVSIPTNGISSLTLGASVSTTYSGVIQGPINLIKNNIGTFTIANDQSLARPTVNVLFGTLNFSSPAVNPSIGALAGAATATVSVDGLNSLTVGGNDASATFSGTLNGSLPGGLTKIGTGNWTLNGQGNFSGPVTIESGTLMLGGNFSMASFHGPITVELSSTFDLNGVDFTADAISVFGASTVRLGGANLSVNQSATIAGGTITNGSLRSGPYNITNGGFPLRGITTYPTTVVNVNSSCTISNISNGGTFTVAAGVSTPVSMRSPTRAAEPSHSRLGAKSLLRISSRTA